MTNHAAVEAATTQPLNLTTSAPPLQTSRCTLVTSGNNGFEALATALARQLTTHASEMVHLDKNAIGITHWAELPTRMDTHNTEDAFFIIAKNQSPFGFVHCQVNPNKSSEVIIGYVLLPTAWGQGFATEATEALIQWAWNEHADLQHIIAHCAIENHRSQSVLSKLGFEQTGMLSQHRSPSHVLCGDSYQYTLSK